MKNFFLILVGVLWVGCNNIGIFEPPPVTTTDKALIEKLLAAPETVSVEGKKLTLSTYMWRDFQPIAPVDGRPLIVIVFISTIDSTPFPSSVFIDSVFVVNDTVAWKAQLITSDNHQLPFRLEKYARNGPKWGPSIYVDVIIKLRDSNNNTFFLRASH